MAIMTTKPYLPCRAEISARRGKVFALPPTVEAVGGDDSSSDDEPAPAVPTPHAGEMATLPTADDYANLFFCDTSEEEEEFRSSFISQPMKSSAATIVSVSSTATTSHRKKRRRVSFGACVPTFHHLPDVPPANAMTPEERATSWFNRADLEGLKTSAQQTIQAMRARIVDSAAEFKDRTKFRAEMLRLEEDSGSSIRGLEHRVFRRKRTRHMLIRDVLECQAHMKGLAKFGHEMDSNEKLTLLAKASRERSATARGVAFVDAKDDCEEVYGEDKSRADARACKRQRQQARQVSM